MGGLVVDDQSLLALFRANGLECDRIAPRTFKGRFGKRGRVFPVSAIVDESGLLCLAIVPFCRSPENEAHAVPFYRRMLELNHQLLMAKLAIDDDLDVFLEVEYPVADLDASEVKDAVDVLVHYASRLHDELSRLSA